MCDYIMVCYSSQTDNIRNILDLKYYYSFVYRTKLILYIKNLIFPSPESVTKICNSFFNDTPI